jgi:signal transduction histidine kinase
VLSSLRGSFDGLATAGPDLPLAALADLGRVLGLSVGVRVDGAPRLLSGEISQVVFRVVQESLTNAARHALHAQVQVGLVYGEHTLDVQVSNSGPGDAGEHVIPLPGSGSGFGLSGMAERVEAVHGELSCGPSEDGGFRVHARLPLVAQP